MIDDSEMQELLGRLSALCELEDVHFFIALSRDEGDSYRVSENVSDLDEFVPHPPDNPVKVLSRGEDFVNMVKNIFDMEQTV